MAQHRVSGGRGNPVTGGDPAGPTGGSPAASRSAAQSSGRCGQDCGADGRAGRPYGRAVGAVAVGPACGGGMGDPEALGRAADAPAVLDDAAGQARRRPVSVSGVLRWGIEGFPFGAAV